MGSRRMTGRTTRMIQYAVAKYREGNSVVLYASSYSHSIDLFAMIENELGMRRTHERLTILSTDEGNAPAMKDMHTVVYITVRVISGYFNWVQ